ncbi:hypothetical protein ACJJIU_00280 [Microbulbifer sp. CnH-101-E]|uniref:hypothetical protein n=1 Tax=unclassified Microbulbifer TaxID=2619833 RepID=UPI0040391282
MSNTPNNGIPYAQEGTLDPVVSLNQALDKVDALLQLEVQAIQNDPPARASDRYLVATGIGAWASKERYVERQATGNPPAKVALNKADGLLYVNGSNGWQIASRP